MEGAGNRSLRLALGLLAVVTLILAGIELTLFLSAGTAPHWVLALYVAVAVEYVLGGLLAWLWRPSNRMGLLLCLGGLSLLVAALENTEVPALVAVGLITAELPIALIVQIVLAFPSGRLNGRLARGLVVGGYVMTTVLRAPHWLFSDPPGGLNGVLEVAHRPDLAHVGMIVQDVADVLVIGGTALVLALRLAGARSIQRPVLAVADLLAVAHRGLGDAHALGDVGLGNGARDPVGIGVTAQRDQDVLALGLGQRFGECVCARLRCPARERQPSDRFGHHRGGNCGHDLPDKSRAGHPGAATVPLAGGVTHGRCQPTQTRERAKEKW